MDFNGVGSTFRSVPHCVPQGSILGPALFFVLVHDLPCTITGTGTGNRSGVDHGGGNSRRNSRHCSLEVGILGYADVVACWDAGMDASAVKEQLEGVSTALVNYCSLIYLALNEKKTPVICSGHPSLPIKVGANEVKPGQNFEFLGVNFDRKLTVNPHLTSLISSARSLAKI